VPTLNVLFIGDVVANAGVKAIARHLPRLRREVPIHLAIANGENAAGGFGLTRAVADEIFAAGVDVITGGNHLWDKKEILDFIDREPRIIRPANYPPTVAGARSGVFTSTNKHRVAVLSLMGRVFMPTVDCPFQCADEMIPALRRETPIVIVDVHAEATSEKVALGWYLDGQVSAILGTHTHVQTADERVLPAGTAYLSDVGMTGPYESVIGIEKEQAIRRFLTQTPHRMTPATGDPRLAAAVIAIDVETGRAQSIRRLLCREADG
jgi:2',3'-cyclic-nucleotide 2'-phosphodiesterase